MISLIALIALAPRLSWDTIDIASPKYRDAIVAGVTKSVSRADYPDKGEPLVRSWQGSDNGIEVNVSVALPPPVDEEGEEITTGVDAVKKEIAADRKLVNRDGGKTMTLDRSGLKVRLSLGYDIYGNMRATESCESPVIFKRTITAKADRVEEAENILKTLTIRNSSGDAVPIYPKGIPRGWTAKIGEKPIFIPRPQDNEKVESANGPLYIIGFEEGQSRWYVEDFFNEYKGSVTDLAKKPHLYSEALGPEPTVTGADIVTWEGLPLLRVRGEAGRGEFKEDWICWYARTDSGLLDAVLAMRKKGGKWPTELPFDPEAAGSAVTETSWAEADSLKTRTVTGANGASISLEVYGHPQPNGANISFSADGSTYASEVLTGEDADKVWNGCDPGKSWDLPRFGAAGVIDVYVRRTDKAQWLLARQLIPNTDPKAPKVRRFEMLRTVQNGTPFLIWLVGWDNESYRNGMRNTMMSARGMAGDQLLDKYAFGGGVTTEYYLPYFQLKYDLNFAAPATVDVTSSTAARLAGWSLPDETKVLFSYDRSDKSKSPRNVAFGEREGWKRYGPLRFFDVKAFGEDAKVEEGEWDDTPNHIRYTLTSVSHRNGVTVHFMRVWKSSDKGWRDFIARK